MYILRRQSLEPERGEPHLRTLLQGCYSWVTSLVWIKKDLVLEEKEEVGLPVLPVFVVGPREK